MENKGGGGLIKKTKCGQPPTTHGVRKTIRREKQKKKRENKKNNIYIYTHLIARSRFREREE